MVAARESPLCSRASVRERISPLAELIYTQGKRGREKDAKKSIINTEASKPARTADEHRGYY